MKLILSFLSLLLYSKTILPQNIERKIVIQNNSFFYASIHEEFQIATLHTGNISKSLKNARKLALPAGRNYNEPVNPFSWDITNHFMYAVSFLNHPLNSKMDALKRYKLSSLKEWNDSISVMDMIMESVEQNRFAYNEPYQFMIHRSNYLNGFYFDGIVLSDSSYVMLIVNNNQLSIWKYTQEKWTHSEVQTLIVDGFFTLFEMNKQLYILLNNGNVHKVSEERVHSSPLVITNKTLKEHLLVLNRDKNTVQLIKISELNTQLPFKELVEKKGKYIF